MIGNPKYYPTQEQVITAIEDRDIGTANPGFCLACGEESDECEPDARKYKCECCGERAVFGAEEVLLMGAYKL